MGITHIPMGGWIEHIKAQLGGLAPTMPAPPSIPPSYAGSACASPRAGASPISSVDFLATAAVAACHTGLELGPAQGAAGPTQGAEVGPPPFPLDLPLGSALGEGTFWTVPPSPAIVEAHAARTLSAGCRHVSAGGPDTAASIVGCPSGGQGRASGKRARTASTADEVREQMRRDNAAKRLRAAGAAPTPTPPTLASALLAAIHNRSHWSTVEESDLAIQAPAPAQPCHSAASSATSPPPHAGGTRQGPAARPQTPTSSCVMPYPIAQRYIQSFARKLGWEVVGDEVALHPLY